MGKRRIDVKDEGGGKGGVKWENGGRRSGECRRKSPLIGMGTLPCLETQPPKYISNLICLIRDINERFFNTPSVLQVLVFLIIQNNKKYKVLIQSHPMLSDELCLVN